MKGRLKMKKLFSVLALLVVLFMIFPAQAKEELKEKDADVVVKEDGKEVETEAVEENSAEIEPQVRVPLFVNSGLVVQRPEWWAKATPEDVENMLPENIEIRNRMQYTPLMLAAMFSPNPQVAETLIEHGANVNAYHKDGITVFMLAVKHNPNPQVIEALMAKGADINAVDKSGKSVLDYAKNNAKFYQTNAYKRLESLVKK